MLAAAQRRNEHYLFQVLKIGRHPFHSSGYF
jgi:hypothetical protein